MTLHWPDLVLVMAIVIAGCGVSYLLLLGKLRHMLAENRRDMERRLAALTAATMMRAAAPSATDALSATEIEAGPAAAGASAGQAAQVRMSDGRQETGERESRQQQEGIPPEIQAAIAAAAIAMLGNHARVRSARRIPSSNVVSPWTQQGRVIVQSSHNLRTQGSR